MTAGDQALNEALSAVMDGRATPAEWSLVKAAWARDPALRERWALWHAAGDGLRSAELPTLHRDPAALLDALHARLPASVIDHPRRRDWFAPLAVAAGFVAMAVGLGALRPFAAPEPVTVATGGASLPQGLVGMSFAQAATGRTLTVWGNSQENIQEYSLAPQAGAQIIDWGAAAPEPAASRARP
ncbi:sigma-E factor negative regulatory protein [Roseateles cellulosilyticus]|uniref:Sigma-E factor negative regulatory protein n=1 Tax=Pelomonas cellulosilytica TaxID=2906762 RepID=A0ABS8Y1M6_9BURK|nr:sigma-E factor negative regulatory protein [Pelomonas sp. P8]MCE4557915.1 sigma-E factor negative regulatory protein [Pelomonas sp. P8]